MYVHQNPNSSVTADNQVYVDTPIFTQNVLYNTILKSGTSYAKQPAYYQ
jgi:hypothetical protein